MAQETLFSTRNGYKNFPEIQIREEMSDDLKMGIWNCFTLCIFQNNDFIKKGSNIRQYAKILWFYFFKEPIILINAWSLNHTIAEIWKRYSSLEWNNVYDFIEISINALQKITFDTEDLTYMLNQVFEIEFSPYRIIDGIVSEVISQQEVEMLSDTLADPDFPAVKKHLKRALELLSDRAKPDYRNSIKESISAVESLAQHIVGKSNATLGDALKILEKSHNLHPSLKEGFIKLYGYTNNEDGIRHAIFDKEPDLTIHDAKFFLLSCTSFINYLKTKL